MSDAAEITRHRIYPPVYFFAGLLTAWGLHSWLPLARFDTPWLRPAGLALIAAGVAVAVWCRILFAKKQTTIKPFQESSALVVEGPFRVSRNPMYLSMTLVLVGTAAALRSLSAFAIAPAFATWIHSRFIRSEEAMLERSFGQEYQRYCNRVRRWI